MATPSGSGSGLAASQSPATQALAGQQPAVNEWQQKYDALQQEFNRLQPYARLGWQAHQQQQVAQPAQGQPVAAKPQNPFGLPEFDHSLIQFIKRDPASGQLVVDPGAPPDTLSRYQAYTQKFQEVQPQFWNDPMKFLGEQVRKMALEVAQQQVQQHLGGYQEQVQARTILERNADWLYTKDAQGQRQFTTDPMTGQVAPALSPYGQVYSKFVREAADLGITTAAKQDQYATAMLQNAIHNARMQQQAGQQTGQANAQQFLQTAAATAASPPPPAAVINPPAPANPISLRDRMRQNFDANGVTDKTLANGVA